MVRRIRTAGAYRDVFVLRSRRNSTHSCSSHPLLNRACFEAVRWCSIRLFAVVGVGVLDLLQSASAAPSLGACRCCWRSSSGPQHHPMCPTSPRRQDPVPLQRSHREPAPLHHRRRFAPCFPRNRQATPHSVPPPVLLAFPPKGDVVASPRLKLFKSAFLN